MSRLDRPDSTGGGAGIGGGARVGAGIEGKPGSNVRPLFKNGNANPLEGPRPLGEPALNNNKYKYSGNTQGSKKPQPVVNEGTVRVNPKNNPLDGFPKVKEMPTQGQLGTAKGNARGMKAIKKK